MEKTPKISIISPSKNSGKFLRETIDSVLAQIYTNWEHIIIDGDSTDGSLSIIKQYPHIKLISEGDSGPDEAVRKGLVLARGEYVMFCFISDGYIDKYWFKKCVEILDNNQEISLVWGIDQNMLEDGGLCSIPYHSFFSNPPPSGKDFIYHWLIKRTLFSERDLCVRKRVVRECFPVFDPRLIGKESAFLTFFYNFNRLGYLPYLIPQVAACARIHEGAGWEQARSGELKISLKKYFRESKQYHLEIIKRKVRHVYRDGAGNILPEKFSLRRHIIQLAKEKIGMLICCLIPPIFLLVTEKILRRVTAFKNKCTK